MILLNNIILININTLIWVFVGYRLCLKLLVKTEDVKGLYKIDNMFSDYRKIYKACCEIEYVYKCTTMIDYKDGSLIRLYSIQNDTNEDMLEYKCRDIVTKYLGYTYKGLIVVDNILETSMDEHVDCM